MVLVELDFPRKNNQTDAVKAQNAQLQQQLQVRGYPTVWFVSATKTAEAKVNLNALGSSGYVAGGPKVWIDGANQIIKEINLFQSIKSLFGYSMKRDFFLLHVAFQVLMLFFVVAFIGNNLFWLHFFYQSC